jgi:hypothetical protein
MGGCVLRSKTQRAGEPMKILRFTLRDLLWLLVVIGILEAWWLDHRRIEVEAERWAILSKRYKDSKQELDQRAKDLDARELLFDAIQTLTPDSQPLTPDSRHLAPNP